MASLWDSPPEDLVNLEKWDCEGEANCLASANSKLDKNKISTAKNIILNMLKAERETDIAS